MGRQASPNLGAVVAVSARGRTLRSGRAFRRPVPSTYRRVRASAPPGETAHLGPACVLADRHPAGQIALPPGPGRGRLGRPPEMALTAMPTRPSRTRCQQCGAAATWVSLKSAPGCRRTRRDAPRGDTRGVNPSCARGGGARFRRPRAARAGCAADRASRRRRRVPVRSRRAFSPCPSAPRRAGGTGRN